MHKIDIIVDVESPKALECSKCGFKNQHPESIKIGRIVYHILKKFQHENSLIMSANINNTRHAEYIIEMLNFLGVVCETRYSEKIEQLTHPVNIYVIEKINILKEMTK